MRKIKLPQSNCFSVGFTAKDLRKAKSSSSNWS